MNEEPENERQHEFEEILEHVQAGSRWLRHVLLVAGFFAAIAAITLVALYRVLNTTETQSQVRHWLIHRLDESTGGRTEIGQLRWDLLRQTIDLDNVTIHGLEHTGEAPWFHVDHLFLHVGIVGLLQSGVSTHVVLQEARIQSPRWHYEIYADGSTNQPHPKRTPKPGKPFLDTLFDLRIGNLQVANGVLLLANRTVPLDFRAQNASLYLGWLPSVAASQQSSLTTPAKQADGIYRIVVDLKQITFWQGPLTDQVPAMQSALTVRALLYRDRLDLEELRLAAMKQTLMVHGTIRNFADPRWNFSTSGAVDLRVLLPATGFPALPEGVATLNFQVNGQGAEYVAEGTVLGTNVRYKDAIADAHVNQVTAHFRATPALLTVTQIAAVLKEGGEVDGDFTYDNWLFPTPHPGSPEEHRYLAAHQKVPTSTARIHANLHHVSLDTVLLDLASPQFRHLGFDAQVNGSTLTTWTGLAYDLAIEGHLQLTPTGLQRSGLAAVHGSVDGTFHASSGDIAITQMLIHLPHSTVAGSGTLGVFPINKPSKMQLEMTTSDLTEFDATLRALELKSGNRVGAAALPAVFDQPALHGSGTFRGTFTSSWLTPVVDGHVTASHLGIEIPQPGVDTPPKFVDWDSVDADGRYSPASILVRSAQLRRGNATLKLSGEIDSSDPNYNLADTADEFDTHAMLRVVADVQQYPIRDLLPLANIRAPLDGELSGHIDLKGRANALAGNANLRFAHPMIQGVELSSADMSLGIHDQTVDIQRLHLMQGKGNVSASGSIHFADKTFHASADGSLISIAPLLAASSSTMSLQGLLQFHAIGDGSLENPHLHAHAVLSKIQLADQPFSDLNLDAEMRDHQAAYSVRSKQSAGDLLLQGKTQIQGQLPTEANLSLTHFDLGAALEMMHITGITGQSDWEGKGYIAGPLTQPKAMHGEARLNQLTAVLEGVPLSSHGDVHLVLANGIAHLDPVEITGEDTDVHLHADVQIVGNQQLDIAAQGGVNLRLMESLDSDLVASGSSQFQLSVNGTLSKPILGGDVTFHLGALALRDFPSGLSQIEGRLEFSQNRLEVRTLTATSGGGTLQMGGYLSFQNALYADLTATGKEIRIRYPQGVSSLADAKLRLQGPQNHLLLSGNVVVTRFAIGSDLDLASLSSPSTSVQPVVNSSAPSNHLRLDVHLTTSPMLTFQNAYNAKLAGDADLHLRGTLASPSVLGKISLTEGSASIGGTRYELQRGDITFNNPVRIEPNIDLDATARVEDYDIILGLHGTPGRLKISYRSEPPLPETDVISLLTQGQTTEEQSVYVQQQQQQAGDNPETAMLLGGALNATVSNRVQRLFGSGAVRVDPNFIGSVGNSSARVTVVEQLGPNLTFTFASNVNTTAQQLIQAEYAVNRHVSLLITQDENGIFSVVIKTRRRYR